jgi:hypothetical protein
VGFSNVENVIGQRVKRDITRMKVFAEGGLEKAARSIMSTPNAHVGIVTGFFIRHATPPSPETDGLGGMAHLAAGLSNAGIPVTVITDAPCSKAIWAVTTELPKGIALEIVGVGESSVKSLRDRLTGGARPLTHLIAIERVSPGSDGKPHREHGWDMTADTAPLHLLFEETGWDRPWVTIGIGDGGNEIGMGVLPKDIIASDIPNGSLVAAAIRTDHLIVAGVSTWGGYGLLSAMAMVAPQRQAELLRDFTPEMDKRYLTAAVEVGQAVDDSRPERPGRPQMSVDGLPWERHAGLLTELIALVAAHSAASGAGGAATRI